EDVALGLLMDRRVVPQRLAPELLRRFEDLALEQLLELLFERLLARGLGAIRGRACHLFSLPLRVVDRDDDRVALATARPYRGHASEASTRARAPSLMPGELPAVCESWPGIGLSLESASRLASRRGPSSISTVVSPFLPLTVTSTISSGNRPASVASTASWWLRSAKRSMSARVISSSSATWPASGAICLPVNGFVSPSCVMTSTTVASPIL